MFALRIMLLEMTRDHVQGSVFNLSVLFYSCLTCVCQMLNIFLVVGYGQVKGSIIYERETVLTAYW